MPHAPLTVLAIDPGSVKCGVAVVRRAPSGEPDPDAGQPPPTRHQVLHREITERNRLVARVLPLVAAHAVDVVLVGDATGGAALRRALRDALDPDLPVHAVDEAFTTQRARQRFHFENPPRGWRRLVPPGFRTPPRPFDDYVAVLLAEDFFAADSAR